MANEVALTGNDPNLMFLGSDKQRAELAQLMNDATTGGRIVIKAVYGKQQGKMKIHPRSYRNKLMGVKVYSEDEKRSLPAHLIVTVDSYFTLEDDVELNLSDEKDRVIWGWLQYCIEDVALSRDAAQASPDCFFYVQNEEKEIMIRLSKAKLYKKALDYIYSEGSQTKLADICRLLGSRMESAKPLDIEEYLVSLAEKTPQRVIDAFTDKNARVKLFLLKAKDMRIITINPAGIYKYGEITVGITEEHAIEWLKNPDNASLVAHIKAEVYPDYFGDKVPDEAFGAPAKPVKFQRSAPVQEPEPTRKETEEPEEDLSSGVTFKEAGGQDTATSSVAGADEFDENLEDLGGEQISQAINQAVDQAKLTPAQKGAQTKKANEEAKAAKK